MPGIGTPLASKLAARKPGFTCDSVQKLRASSPAEISNTSASATSASASAERSRPAPLTVRATIANTGRIAATEVVQLYVHDIAASVTQPVRLLKAFTRVPLAPGERREVTFTLTRADLSFIGRDLRPTIEPGAFRLWVAPSAEAEGLAATFTLA